MTSSSAFSTMIGQDEISALAASGGVVRGDPGQILFRQGDPCFSLYWVLEGEVEMFVEPSQNHPRERVISSIGVGGVVGEFALFAIGGRRTASVRMGPGGAALLDVPVNPVELLRDQMGDPVAGYRVLQALVDSTVHRFLKALGERENAAVVGGHTGDAMDDGLDAVLNGITASRRWWQRGAVRHWMAGQTIQAGWSGDRVVLILSGAGRLDLVGWKGGMTGEDTVCEFRAPCLVPLGQRSGGDGLPGVRVRLTEETEGVVFRWSRFVSRGQEPDGEDFLALLGAARILVAQIQDVNP